MLLKKISKIFNVSLMFLNMEKFFFSKKNFFFKIYMDSQKPMNSFDTNERIL